MPVLLTEEKKWEITRLLSEAEGISKAKGDNWYTLALGKIREAIGINYEDPRIPKAQSDLESARPRQPKVKPLVRTYSWTNLPIGLRTAEEAATTKA